MMPDEAANLNMLHSQAVERQASACSSLRILMLARAKLTFANVEVQGLG
jgi:hypothetical protein